MCQNVFKNDEAKKRKENFTKLFVEVVSNSINSHAVTISKKKSTV